MDTIILAAGENVRLQVAGLAPGRKPLIIREGEVLIRRLCRQAQEMHGGRVVVVTSPSNTEDIVFATKDYATHYVVQAVPRGPQDAVDIALNVLRSNRTMLLMGDNFIRELPSQFHTGLCTIRSSDTHLQPLVNGRFVYEDDVASMPMCDRWLGPLYFMPQFWHRGESDWVMAFKDAPRFNYYTCEAEDMGTL